MAAGARRVDRLTRWLGDHQDAVELRLERRVDDAAPELLVLESDPARLAQSRVMAEVLDRAVQDAANADGCQVRGTVVVLKASEREVTTTVVARPDPDATESDPTSTDAMNGSAQSLVMQTQRHNEALVRMSVDERRCMTDGMRQMSAGLADMVSQVTALCAHLGERLASAERRLDDLREEMLQAVEEAAQDAEMAEAPPPIPPQLEQLAGVALAKLMSPPSNRNPPD